MDGCSAMKRMTMLSLVVVFVVCIGGAGARAWSPAVLERIDATVAAAERIEGEPAPVAVFDFDNTMIYGDISFALMSVLGDTLAFGFDPAGPDSIFSGTAKDRFAALKEAKERSEVARIRRELSFEIYDHVFRIWRAGHKAAACGELTRLLTGLRVSEVRRLALLAFKGQLKHPVCERQLGSPDERESISVHHGIRTRTPIHWMLEHLRTAGVEIWVVSASPERVVEAVAQAAYGIPAERVLGVRSREDEGVMTGAVLAPITYRQGKVAAIRRSIKRRPLIVFGDAWTDFEMLTTAELGVLIDRGRTDLVKAVSLTGTVVVQPRFPGEAPAKPCQPNLPEAPSPSR